MRLLSLSHQFGLSKAAVGSSLTGHVGVETALGGLIGLSLLFSPKMRETVQSVFGAFIGTDTVLLILTVVGLLIVILFLILTLSSKARQFLKTLRNSGTPLVQKPFRHQ